MAMMRMVVLIMIWRDNEFIMVGCVHNLVFLVFSSVMHIQKEKYTNVCSGF